ncbi:MAG: S41 family peptidase [Candidatus Limnocylindria bacterium]
MRSRLLPLLLATAFAASCGLVPPEVTRQIGGQSSYKTAEAAFHVLLERHVDHPGSEQLLAGALDSVEAQLKKDGIADAKVDRPTFTGSTESDFAKFSETLNVVGQNYAGEKPETLERAATEGMAKSLNECHTYYLDPDRAKTFNQPPGPYSGIGAQIQAPSPNELPEITNVFPDSPAQKAGVQSGDKIKTVDGTDVLGFTAEEVANRIKGPEATTVRLTLVRQGTEKEFSIVRAKLTPPRVVTQTLESGTIGYIQVGALNGDVADLVAADVTRAVAAGAKAYILDLRNDPGGDLSSAVNIGSVFMKNATLVFQTGRDGQRQPLRTNDRYFSGFDKPLVVLVNKNSASGAEIIAAGVRANGVGTVLGQRTAGCVGIGQPREMPDGGILLVTLARMQDAKTGEELNGPGRGVVPDVTVDGDDDATSRDAAIAFLKMKL